MITGRVPSIDSNGRYGASKLHQLDLDGLPFVGAYLEDGDALYRSDKHTSCVTGSQLKSPHS